MTQVLHPLINFRQPLFDQRLNFNARRLPITRRSQQGPDVLQCETDRLRRPDEFQFVKRSRVVDPVVPSAPGVSSAEIGAMLETVRPFFMAITFSFLAAAFYFTYRRQKPAAVAGDTSFSLEGSKTAVCCASATQGPVHGMALNKVIFWGATVVLAVAFLLFPDYVGIFLGAGDAKSVAASMNRAVVKVEGMTCQCCAAVVAKTIQSVSGVLAVQVGYPKGEAVIGTEACCRIPIEKISQELQAAGYQVKAVESATVGVEIPDGKTKETP